jgi:Lrp/AsnC family leucine-responsive transcriptional regulator
MEPNAELCLQIEGDRWMGPKIPEMLRDARNVKLLRLLRENPRISVSELARRVGMSPPATRERIQRLEEAGVIQGTRVELDAKALGYPIAAFVRVRPMPGKLPKIAELARKMPQVVECHRITGEDCFIMKIYLEELDALDRVLDRFLAYGQTTTSLIQSSPVPPRGLPLPGDARE